MAKKSHKKEENNQEKESLVVVSESEDSDDELIDIGEALFLDPDDEEVDSFVSSDDQESPEEEAVAEEEKEAESAVPTHEEMQKLREQLEQAKKTGDEFRDQLLRKAADLENSRRRSKKQMEEVKAFGNMVVLREFLPVIDDLARAIEHAQGSNGANKSNGEKEFSVDNFIEGTELVFKKLLSIFERFGVEGFDSVGEQFDPEVHEAISQVDSDRYDDGAVVSEFLRGYRLKDRLIRPALVAVARNPAPDDGQVEEESAEAEVDGKTEDGVEKSDEVVKPTSSTEKETDEAEEKSSQDSEN